MFQCRWEFWGNFGDKGDIKLHRSSRMETARYLQVFLRNWRRIFSIRRANLCHEIRFVDLRWLPGKCGIWYRYYSLLSPRFLWLAFLLSLYLYVFYFNSLLTLSRFGAAAMCSGFARISRKLNFIFGLAWNKGIFAGRYCLPNGNCDYLKIFN